MDPRKKAVNGLIARSNRCLRISVLKQVAQATSAFAFLARLCIDVGLWPAKNRNAAWCPSRSGRQVAFLIARLRFAAHVAHYPVCSAVNNPAILQGLQPAQAGTQFLNLTGAPVLIQVGTEDDYDNGAEHCFALADDSTDPAGQCSLEVAAYEGAFHACDRLQVPITSLGRR